MWCYMELYGSQLDMDMDVLNIIWMSYLHNCAVWAWAYCRHSHRWFAVMEIRYKGTLSSTPHCSRCRRINEVDISTSVVDQHATNYPDEAVLSFTAMRSRCRSSRFDVIPCQFLELFGARRSTASRLTSFWNC